VAQGGGAAGADLPAPAQGPDGGTAGSPFVLNETCTPAHSPSRVTSDAFVLELTFESNVTVKVCGNFVFEVAGQLQVEGASHAPIRFTPHDLTIGWRSFRFHDAEPGCCLACAGVRQVSG
jgi:hypothetical protein